MRILRIVPAALAALVPLGLALVPSTSSASAPPPALGAGAVVEAHHRLFAALDALDAAAVNQRLTTATRLGGTVDAQGNWSDAPSFRLSIVGAGGAVTSAGDAASGATALVEWARAGGSGTTKILSGWSDCYSKDLGFAVLEFERRGGEGRPAQRYLSTSFARGSDEGWKIYFWQITPVSSDGKIAAR